MNDIRYQYTARQFENLQADLWAKERQLQESIKSANTWRKEVQRLEAELARLQKRLE
jgi:peptidoglycan hydrolase CwlO-like protein